MNQFHSHYLNLGTLWSLLAGWYILTLIFSGNKRYNTVLDSTFFSPSALWIWQHRSVYCWLFRNACSFNRWMVARIMLMEF